ncbi:DUF2505 family protein [Acinetobacter bouvetii]|uniref:DUF2505 family protein n=1 Tax=Acinetobacter bouvetii TaxID=202951 RepID=A0A811GD54_9GAMM|nr:DUF2505 family protein [Acinetobacter bouvetii]CAB1216078.1 hypothetical protein SFB21_1855 [Acinetobacter bouvetii]
MGHRFTVNSTIQGVSIDQFKQLAADTTLHEAVCRRIPGENLEIIESQIQGGTYTLRRAYNLDVNIPDIAKKFLKDAFRVKRTDITNLTALTSTIELGANLPLEANCERAVTGNDQQVHITLNWHVKVKVPLISGMLEKHAEGEIRKFSALEIEIVEDELKKNLSA